MARPRPFNPTRLVIGLAPLAALLLSACAAPPPEPNLPRISDIRSSRHDAIVREALERTPDVTALVTVRQVDLHLDVVTDEAWDLIDESVIPRLTRAVWQNNGLRVGVVDAAKLPDIARVVGEPMAVRDAQLTASDIPTAIRRSPPLRTTVPVDLTVPPYAPRIEHAEGGRMQLLARVERDTAGRLLLDLIPHHHLPRPTFHARHPMEKALDGRVFESIAVRVALSRRQLLVVGLHRPGGEESPPPAAEQTKDAQARAMTANPSERSSPADRPTADDDAENPASPPTADRDTDDAQQDNDVTPPAPEPEWTPPPVPPIHLGRALLTAERAHEPLQMILFISIEPLDRPASTSPSDWQERG